MISDRVRFKSDYFNFFKKMGQVGSGSDGFFGLGHVLPSLLVLVRMPMPKCDNMLHQSLLTDEWFLYYITCRGEDEDGNCPCFYIS
jgi:hypothetical protein